MRPFLLKTLIVLTLAAPGLALAEPPALVGRISLAEGQVTLATDGAEDAGQALLNWPVTGDSRIVTGRGALAEFRVGSAAVRLAADSELEVAQLDDDNFRLRLNYGSVGVRVASPAMLAGFELLTDQARVTLTQPGWLRVDAQRDASVVGVLAGQAEVEGGGSFVTLAAGKRAQVGADELRLGALRRDAFDDWPQRGDAPALRYVDQSVTGYEELDRYGSWRVDPEYGALWQPAALPAGWAPYRYGSWSWIAPWGWTWIDDAPWGYAPSHYGRWVLVGQRWSWAPGRREVRAAWAPALVGWVGGSQWQVTFAARDGRRSGPGVGWFPLSPRDSYTPAYRVSPDHQRRLDWRHDGAGPRRAAPQQERAGLTVVPVEQFRARGTVPVTRAPQALINASTLKTMPPAMAAAPVAAPPAPRSEGPRRLAPRFETPRVESPRIDTQRIDTQRHERADERRNVAPAAGLNLPAPRAEGPRRLEPRLDTPRIDTQRPERATEWRTEERRTPPPAAGIAAPERIQERRVEQERILERRAGQERIQPGTPATLSTEPRAPAPAAPLARPDRGGEAQPELRHGPRRLEPAPAGEPRAAIPAAAEPRPEPIQPRHVREAAVAPPPQAAPAQPAPTQQVRAPQPALSAPMPAPAARALAPAPVRMEAPVARPVLPAPPQVERPPSRAPAPETSPRRAEHEQGGPERGDGRKGRPEKRDEAQPR